MLLLGCSIFHQRVRDQDVIDGEIDAQLSRQNTAESLKIWVGKDYVNFIYKDFVELDNPFTGWFSLEIVVSAFWCPLCLHKLIEL